MKKLIEGLAFLPVALFWVLNVFGGIIGGIWLIIVGDWGVAVGALVTAVIAPFILGIIIAVIQVPLGGLGILLSNKGWKILSYPVLYLSVLLMDMLALVWIYISFNNILNSGESTNIIPFLLVAYALAVTPFAHMAKGESPDSIGTNLALLFITFSSVIWAVCWFFISYPAVSVIGAIVILILMFGKQILQLYIVHAQQKAESLSE